ncbi:MAG: alkaline phosphatase D family protein [Erythrobacter sp.]
MRRLTLFATPIALVAASLAAAPLLAGQPAGAEASRPLMSLSADAALAPYYDELRQRVTLPVAGPNPAIAPQTTLTRIAFGSCNHQSAPQHMWAQIAAQNPQLFLMIGDNVYGDNGWDADADLDSLRAAYALQASHREFAEFRARVPMLVTWDDHDYGLNDAGGRFPFKRWAEEIFTTFWGSSDEVRSRPGVYESHMIGAEGRRVQIIMLDTRYFRSDFKRMEWSRTRAPLGIYLPNDDPAATVLGDEQWQWLEQELARPADLRIVVSSTQVLTEAHNFEGWTNFPLERARLLEMLEARSPSGLVVLTGDRHAGAIYKDRSPDGSEEIWEFTSSSLNLAFSNDVEASTKREPDPRRVTQFFGIENYGLVDINWDERRLTMSLMGNTSETLAQESFGW